MHPVDRHPGVVGEPRNPTPNKESAATDTALLVFCVAGTVVFALVGVNVLLDWWRQWRGK